LRSFEVRISIARIFATAYLLNALFISHLLSHFIPASMSFAPWMVLFLHRYYQRPRFFYLAICGIPLALGFMAGNVQSAAMLFAILVLFWASLVWNGKDRWRAFLFRAPLIVL